SQWTNRRWMVVVSAEAGQPTVRSQNDARQAELKTGVRAEPLVQAVLARFPGARIVGVRKSAAGLPPELPPGASQEAPAEPAPDHDGSAFGAQFPHIGPPDEADDDL